MHGSVESYKALSGFQIHDLTPHLSPSVPPSRTGVLDSHYRGEWRPHGDTGRVRADPGLRSVVASPSLLPRPPSAACPCLCFPRIALSDTRAHNATRATVKCNSCNPKPQMLVAPLEQSQGRDDSSLPHPISQWFLTTLPPAGRNDCLSLLLGKCPQLRARLRRKSRAMC